MDLAVLRDYMVQGIRVWGFRGIWKFPIMSGTVWGRGHNKDYNISVSILGPRI